MIESAVESVLKSVDVRVNTCRCEPVVDCFRLVLKTDGKFVLVRLTYVDGGGACSFVKVGTYEQTEERLTLDVKAELDDEILEEMLEKFEKEMSYNDDMNDVMNNVDKLLKYLAEGVDIKPEDFKVKGFSKDFVKLVRTTNGWIFDEPTMHFQDCESSGYHVLV